MSIFKSFILPGLFISAALFNVACDEPVLASNFKPVDEPPVPIDTIDYLALGDSYTIGQSVDPTERWPNQLVEALKEDGYNVGELKIIARTGWTTTNLLEAIAAEELAEFQLVSLLIGVNNQYQGKPFELFEEEFELLLNKAIELAGGKENVFVVSIPDYGVTPFGAANSFTIAQELDAYNAHMAGRCVSLDIPFIDITRISRAMGASEGALAPDDLHPSGEQYGRWVDSIFPVVRELLNK